MLDLLILALLLAASALVQAVLASDLLTRLRRS